MVHNPKWSFSSFLPTYFQFERTFHFIFSDRFTVHVSPSPVSTTCPIELNATTSTLFIATAKVAVFGRHHTRGGEACGRASSFVVAFVVAMNRVDVVAVNSIGQVVLTGALTDGYVKSI